MTGERFTFADLFSGIGGMRLPFQELGGKCVFSSEIDPIARETYFENFKEYPSGDITKIDASDIPDHDILLAGFPCQPFSIIGNMLGFADTRGTLFFEIERIIRKKRPRAFLLENVKQLKSHDHGRTLKIILLKLRDLGYNVEWAVLDARNFGLPQKRERIFIVGFLGNLKFRFPTCSGPPLRLEDVLLPEDQVPDEYRASEYIIKKRQMQTKGKKKFEPSIWHENKSGNVAINDYSCALRAGASHNYILINGRRLPTPSELLGIQGFPKDFIILGEYSEIRKQLGNTVAVPVVRALATAIVDLISQKIGETNERAGSLESFEQIN